MGYLVQHTYITNYNSRVYLKIFWYWCINQWYKSTAKFYNLLYHWCSSKHLYPELPTKIISVFICEFKGTIVPLRSTSQTCAAVVAAKIMHVPWPPKYRPLYRAPLYPNQAIQMWMWSRAATSVFAEDICKTLYLLSILEGFCSLLSFPPNWSGQLELSAGGGWGWAKTDRGEPLSDPRLGSNNTAYQPPSIIIAPLGRW